VPIEIDSSSMLASALVPYDALAPAVAYGSTAGQYLVAWEDKAPEKVDYDITARRVGNDGSLVGNEIAVSAWEYDQLKPQLAFNSAANEFLVVWEDHHWAWGEARDIYGQRVSGSGALAGGNFAISWEETNLRENPAVAYKAAANEYLVAWEYEYTPTDHDVYRRRVARNGDLPDGEVAVSSLSSWEGQPALAADAGDAYLVVWEDGRDAATKGLDLWADLVRLPAATPTHTPTATPTRTPTSPLSPSPTATLPSGCPDWLVNGGFESGVWSPWQASGAVSLGPGRGSAFGAAMVAQGPASAGLSQDAALPGQANPAWLDFWWLADNGVEQPEDRLIVYAGTDVGATQLRDLPAVSPLGEWRHEVIDLTPFAGHLQRVMFTTYGDDGLPTTFVLDDIHLFACGVPTPTRTPTPTPTATRIDTPTPTRTVPSPTRTATPTGSATPPPPPADEPLPDLVVTDIWNEERAICYQVHNAGPALAGRGHESALFIDGAYRLSQTVDVDLEPDARWRGCFDYVWECSGAEDRVAVQADHRGTVADGDVDNNFREESWKCDVSPPEIVGGPRVSELTQHSALITWETNENSDGVVQYGRAARVYAMQATEPGALTRHAIALTELEPSTTYHFRAQSTDASENTATARDGTFQTLPAADGLDPQVSLLDPGICRNTVTIVAVASDNTAVERVEFYLADAAASGQYPLPDGTMPASALVMTDTSPAGRKFIDYTAPFEFVVDTTRFANGQYAVTARAVDLSGRSAVDERAVSIANKVDLSAPQVNLYHPSAGATVSGDQRILVEVTDDTGVSEIDFYANTTQLSGIHYPTTPSSVHFTVADPFWWHTNVFPNGAYTVTVVATDEDGKVGSAAVHVTLNNTGGPLRPKLVVSKHQVTRHGNYLIVDLWIENKGAATASRVRIEDSLQGFQPLSGWDAGHSVEYRAELNASTFEAACVISDSLSLAPGGTRYYTFKVVPVLGHPTTPKPSIGDHIEFAYDGPVGTSYAETVAFTIQKTTLNYPDVSIPTAHSDALKAANYVLVTNPSRVFGILALAAIFGADVGPQIDDANELMASMAHLAYLEDGAVGYINTYDAPTLRSLLAPGGGWAKKLSAGFSTPLGGYVLLVGESEIVPNWYYPQPGTGPIHHSDQPYSDVVGNDDWPELVVGRIIGNTYKELAKAIKTAIGIAAGSPGYGLDRSDALVVAGGCGGDNAWQLDADEKIAILDDQFTVDELFCLDYFDLSSFNAAFSVDDGLAVGNVGGTAQAEIVVGDLPTDKIRVYSSAGVKLKEFACGYGGSEFAMDDGLAVANGNIVMADASADRILYYNWSGVLQSSFVLSFDAGDALACGDVAGDSTEDLIIADASADKVYFFTPQGIKLGEFSCTFGTQDGLAVGDVLGNNARQILRANRSTGMVEVYNKLGAKQSSFSAGWASGDGFAVGDVMGSAQAEVLVADDSSDRVRIFSYWVDPQGKKPSKFMEVLYYDADFAAGDGLAVGNVLGSGKEEVVVGHYPSKAINLSEPTCSGKLTAPFQSRAPGKDVILFTGHGSPDSWCDVIRYGDLPSSFGATNPFVFAATCSSGNYDGNGDNSIGEDFFAHGASAYVGATIPSYDGPASKLFFSKWVQTGNSIGLSFAQTEQGMIYGPKDYYWVREYNLYGDPKLGATVSAPAPVSGHSERSDEPPTSLEVVVPDLNVTSTYGEDHVEIPGGGLLQVDGLPLVPLYSVSLQYPPGYRIQDVELIERSALSTLTGLNIPPAELVSKDGEPGDPAAPGWYPAGEYEWATFYNADGTTELAITMYPFYYNALTTDAQFYGHYTFAIHYTLSGVEVSALTAGQDAYLPGDVVRLELGLSNAGEPEDVTVQAVVKDYATHEWVDGLLLRRLQGLQGPASFSLAWDSAGFEPGYYYVEAAVQDGDGHLLDSKTELFALGILAAEITDLSASPAHFQIGDDVGISLVLRNSGTLPLSGEALLRVQDGLGETVRQFGHEVAGLEPGNSLHLEDVWDTSGASEGTYIIRADLLYEGLSAEPRVAVVGTGPPPGLVYLPVIARSWP